MFYKALAESYQSLAVLWRERRVSMNGYFLPKVIDRVRGDKFLRNSLIFFIGSLLGSIGNYLFHFLIARMLSVESYGELQSLIAVSVIIGIPSSTLFMVLVKYTARFRAKEQISKLYTLFLICTRKTIIFGAFFLVLFYLFSSHIADFLNLNSSWPVLILGMSFAPVFLNSITRGMIQGLQKFKTVSVIGVIEVALKILLAALLVKMGFDVSGAVGAVVLSGAIAYFITFLPLKFLFKQKKSLLETKEISRYFFSVFFSLLFITLLYNIDIVMVKHFLPPYEAGEYGALALIGHIIFFIGGPMVAVMFPMTAAAHSQSADPRAILRKTVVLVALVGLATLFFYFLFPGLIIKVLVGRKFLSISNYLGWFGFSMFFYSLINLFVNYFLSVGRTKCLYFLAAGALAQAVLLSLFHSSFWQIIWVMNLVMLATLALLGIYYFKTKNLYA